MTNFKASLDNCVNKWASSEEQDSCLNEWKAKVLHDCPDCNQTFE